MKKVLFFLFASSLFISNTSAQVVESIINYRKEASISMLELDIIYLNAVHADSTKPAVFLGDAQKEWYDTWGKFLKDFGKHLKENGFYWEEDSRFFNKIYFSKEGKVEYFLYSTKSELFTPEKEKQFAALARSFIAEYELKIEAPISGNFSQCGGIRFTKTSENEK